MRSELFCRYRLPSGAPLPQLASKFGQAQKDLPGHPRLRLRWPKAPLLARTARIGLWSTWGTSRAPSSRKQARSLGRRRLVKTAHLDCSAQNCPQGKRDHLEIQKGPVDMERGQYRTFGPDRNVRTIGRHVINCKDRRGRREGDECPITCQV